MKTRTRTKKTTRTGSKLPGALLLVAALLAPPARGYRKDKKVPEPFAVIAGTTFRPPGFALPGVKVRVEPESAQAAGAKLKPAEAVTDARGEFTVRVPVVPAKWTIYVQANGYLAQSKTVSIDGEQRVELSFRLESAPDKPKGEGK